MSQSKKPSYRPQQVVAYMKPHEREEVIKAAKNDRRSVSDFVGKAAIDAARNQLKRAS